MKRIGFIGYGLRSETMLKAFRALEADICVAAVADPRHAQIAPGTKDDPYFAETRWYEDAAPLLARDDLDGVFIGTRCPLHTPLACRVLKTGMPLFLEKPVCISREQYEALREAGFDVMKAENMELLTVRGYTDELWRKYARGPQVFVRQATQSTVRVVRKK